MRRQRSGLIAVALTLCAACGLLASFLGFGAGSASGAGSGAAAITKVTVIATEFHFELSKTKVPVGAVIFTVENKGKIAHDFKIGGKRTPLIPAGKKATLKVVFKKKGRYAYLCTIPGHAAAGMKGTLAVGVAPPTTTTGRRRRPRPPRPGRDGHGVDVRARVYADALHHSVGQRHLRDDEQRNHHAQLRHRDDLQAGPVSRSGPDRERDGESRGRTDVHLRLRRSIPRGGGYGGHVHAHPLSAPRAFAFFCLGLLLSSAAGCGSGTGALLDGTRSSVTSPISAATVGRLRVRWRFRIPGPDTFSGVDTAAPLVVGDAVYVQDMNSNVYALDRVTGHVRWVHRFGRRSGGPNGLAAAGGMIFGNTDTSTFALRAATGKQLWLRRLTTAGQPIDIAPVAADGIVVTSTVGLPPDGKGTSSLSTRGRGVPVALRHRPRWLDGPARRRRRGALVAGVRRGRPDLCRDGESVPVGGHARASERRRVSRSRAVHQFARRAVGRDGSLLWYDQVIPHDVRDYDFALTPLLVGGETVVGGGKGGRVVAWNRNTHARLWSAAVGVHRNNIRVLCPHIWSRSASGCSAAC